MQLFRAFRWILVILTILYAGTQIMCPTPNCPRTNQICEFADEVPTYVSHFVEPVTSFVGDYYKSSNLHVYVEKTKAITSPYTTIISEKLETVQDQIAVFRERHEERVKKATYDSATKVVKHTTIFMKDTVIPTVCKVCKYVFKQFKYYSFRLKVWSYIKWNIHGVPFVNSMIEKILQSSVGECCIRIYLHPVTESILESFSKAYHFFEKYILIVVQFMTEKIMETYQSNIGFKNSETYKQLQMKTNFLWESLNYLPDQSNDKLDDDISSSTTITLTIISSVTTPSSTAVLSTSQVDASIGSPGLRYDKMFRDTIESAAKDFETQVDAVSRSFKYTLKTEIPPLLSKFTRDLDIKYNQIQTVIDKINAFKDPSDENYVSRQDFRDLLAAEKKSIELEMDKLEEYVTAISQEYLDCVLKIRIGVLETLEEFAEYTLSAYSAQIVSAGESWEEWKKHKELKATLVKFRNEIVDQKPASNFLTDIKVLNQEINILGNESGSFLAILRAKANIEFQQREKEEKEEKEASSRASSRASSTASIATSIETSTDASTDSSIETSADISTNSSIDASTDAPTQSIGSDEMRVVIDK